MATDLPNRFSTFKDVMDNSGAMPDAEDVWSSVDKVTAMPPAADVDAAVASIPRLNRTISSIKRPTHYKSVTNSLVTLSNTFDLSMCLVYLLPVNFNSIRITWPHLGGGGDLVGLNMALAVTDNIGDLSYTNTTDCKVFITPELGGVEYNDKTIRGWQQVTWSGAGKLDITDPGADNIDYVRSDLVNLNPVPLANGTAPDHRALMMRVYLPANTNYSRGSLDGLVDPSKFLAECGDRIILAAARPNSVDPVETPANWIRAFTPSFSDANMPGVLIEALTIDNHVSVLMVGDSRFASVPVPEAAYGYRTLQWKVERQLQAKGIKGSTATASKGGRTVEQYFEAGIGLLDKNQYTYAVYLAFSINDGSPTYTNITNARGRLVEWLDLCAKSGVTPIILTSFPSVLGFNAEQMAWLNAIDDTLAASNIAYLSPLKLYGDEDGDWVDGWNDDANHMTGLGYDDLAERIATLISSN